MKKLMITMTVAAMIMTAGAVNAQTKDTVQPMTSMDNAQTKQEYKEVKATELPKAVAEAVEKDYKGLTVSKAYVSKQDEYKLMLVNEGSKDGEMQTVYISKDGEWQKK